MSKINRVTYERVCFGGAGGGRGEGEIAQERREGCVSLRLCCCHERKLIHLHT